MSLPLPIGFLGAGNMAEALARGILAAGLARPDQLLLSDVRADRLEALARDLGGATIHASNAEVVAKSGTVVFAVKPQVMPAVLEEIGPLDGHPRRLYVTICAGIRSAWIEARLGPGARVVRAMPNTPALIGLGATALCAGAAATPADLDACLALFRAVGVAVTLEERLLDAVTGLSGSGPAYVFLAIEGLLRAAREQGIPDAEGELLVKQMVLGAATLAMRGPQSPAELRRAVTSPKGTTEAGLRVLADRGFEQSLVDAVAAATARARELSGG